MMLPKVTTHRTNSGWNACAALALGAIDWEGLHADGHTIAERLVSRHRATAQMLHAFSRWSVPASLELRLASRPSLDSSVPGGIDVSLRLDCSAPRQELALELCLAQFLSLRALLEAFWPHTEWRAVPDEAAPAGSGSLSGIAILRRRRDVAITRPLVAATRSPGFNSPAALHSPPLEHAAHPFPWVPSWDDGSALLEALLAFPAPLVIAVRVSNQAEASSALAGLENSVETCERVLSAGPSSQVALSGRLQILRDSALVQSGRLGDGALRCELQLLSPGAADEGLAAVLGQYVTGDSTSGSLQGGFDTTVVGPSAASDPTCELGEVMSCEEATCAFRLPLVFAARDHGLPVRRSRTAPYLAPSPAEKQAATFLGVNRHRGVDRPVYIPLEHRFQHAVLFGMTGTGKSTQMLSWMLQDLRQGHGLCLIDAHGELADALLARMPASRSGDVIVVDLADRDHPVPLNLLAWKTIEERDRSIDDLLVSLLRIYRDPQMFGPVFETNFRAMMKLLMGDQPGRKPVLTLLEFPRLYGSRELRHRLLENTSDEQVHDFIREIEAVAFGDHKPENLAPYITSKLGRFVHDTLLRRIVGHGDMKLDFSGILAEGKVVILKLARGRFGSTVADLVASQLVSRIRSATLSRLPRDKQPFFLYIDEAGSMAHDESIAQLLSEGRKFHVGVFLAVQFASQLRDPDRSRDILSAALGNVGTVLTCRVGVEDAGLLEPIFAPAFAARDLIECPNYQGFARLHLKDRVLRPFSFCGVPDAAPPDPARARDVVRRSRKRWSVSISECDKRIRERSQWLNQALRPE